MSTLRHPVGPQPKKVYWRRRLLVLLVLVAIIAVVVLIVVRPGSGAASDAEAPVASQTPAADPAAGADPGAAGGGAGTETSAPGSVDAGAASGDVSACAGGNIQVSPVTDADTYPAGAKPQLSFTITNTGAEPCTLNAGTSQQVYTITSGDETYWTSTDCQTAPSDTEVVLEPGVAVSSTPFTWDRTRSAADTCEAPDRPAAPAGGASYHLDVSVAGIASSDSKQFILS